jgi:hypothetical protein
MRVPRGLRWIVFILRFTQLLLLLLRLFSMPAAFVHVAERRYLRRQVSPIVP